MLPNKLRNLEDGKISYLANKCCQPGVAMFLGLFALLAGMSVAKYFSLHSTYADLGMFLTHFSKPSGEWWRLFVGHAQPLMPAWSFFYHLLPENWGPAVLLAAQAALLAFPAVLLHRHFGVIPALAFVFYFPLWYNALFDFHMDHLAVPLLFGFFFLEKEGKVWTAVLLALLLALVKEPFALQTAACGLYLWLFRKHRLAGGLLIAMGLSYFFVATHYLIPFFSYGARGGLDSSAFSWLGSSLPDMIWFLATKPHIVLHEIISNGGKLSYLFYIFGALGFISLLRPDILLIALPVLAISLLSMESNYYGFMHQYTAGLIAPLIIAFAGGIPRARKIWARVGLPKTFFAPLLLTGLLIFHIKVSPSPIGQVFWDEDSWGYSYRAYIPTPRDKMIKEAIGQHIPSESMTAVSTQNTVNWGYLAHRKYYFPYPFGVLQPLKVVEGSDRSLKELWRFIKTGEMNPTPHENISADYVVLDLKRPWFIGDEGCSWKNGRCQNSGEFSLRFLALVQQTKERFATVFEEDEFYILKRKNLT